MNIRGNTTGDQVMGIAFIFFLAIIALTLSIGISIFFGKGYDFRQAEAEILNYKVRQCLFFKDIDFSNEGNFYVDCKLNKFVLSDNLNQTRLAIKICEDNCVNGRILFQLGSNFESCDFEYKRKEYMKCFKKFVKNEFRKYEVVTGSNHDEEAHYE